MKEQLKILQFTCPAGFYGAERWIMALANNLNPTEVRCDLAVLGEDNHSFGLFKDFPPQVGGVHEFRLRASFDFSIVGRLANFIEKNGITLLHSHGYLFHHSSH